MEGYDWAGSTAGVDWNELSRLYQIAPLGTPSAAELETIYGNCMFASFAYSHGELVAAGRALAMARTVPISLASSSTQSTRARAWARRSFGAWSGRRPATRRSSCTPTRARRVSTPASASCP
jgi:hypothetical protein